MNLLQLTLQMRNSIPNTDNDYLISPVKDDNGNFFDSRNVQNGELPKDADANGEYNIARRGIMVINKIAETEDKKKIMFDLTHKAWLDFAQK
jgi:CRISPR-associated protein Cpf1